MRLALRALYFATLAHLADAKMLSVAKYKSNRDYVSELRRRVHEKKDLVSIFTANVTLFDKAWYGMYEVTMNDIDAFSSNYERITAFAE